MVNSTQLPSTGFVKLTTIIGDKKKNIAGVYPVSKAGWYAGIKRGIYPKGVHLANGRVVAWSVDDIRALLDSHKAA